MITDISPASSQNSALIDPKRVPKRKPKAPLKAPAIVPACQQHIGHPDLWKAPEVWEYSASEPEVSPTDESVVPTGSEELNQLALDLASMQREATRMQAASPRVILLRLKGKWAGFELHTSLETEAENTQEHIDIAVDQALMYKELEMDRKRWMLSALHHMETNLDASSVISKPKVKPKVQKVLSLFDSQGMLASISYPLRAILTFVIIKRPRPISQSRTRASPSTIFLQILYPTSDIQTYTPWSARPSRLPQLVWQQKHSQPSAVCRSRPYYHRRKYRSCSRTSSASSPQAAS